MVARSIPPAWPAADHVQPARSGASKAVAPTGRRVRARGGWSGGEQFLRGKTGAAGETVSRLAMEPIKRVLLCCCRSVQVPPTAGARASGLVEGALLPLGGNSARFCRCRRSRCRRIGVGTRTCPRRSCGALPHVERSLDLPLAPTCPAPQGLLYGAQDGVSEGLPFRES